MPRLWWYRLKGWLMMAAILLLAFGFMHWAFGKAERDCREHGGTLEYYGGKLYVCEAPDGNRLRW